MTDPLRMISSPLDTIPMTSESALAGKLVGLCAERGVKTVVIGLPVSADGSEGPGCLRSRRIAARLTEAGLQVILQNESWSSRSAESALRETGKTRRNAKQKIDAIAASLILRDYLEEASGS
jgi:putative holliday junction resolvase